MHVLGGHLSKLDFSTQFGAAGHLVTRAGPYLDRHELVDRISEPPANGTQREGVAPILNAMRILRRVLLAVLLLLVLFVAAVVGGFQVWKSAQPDDVQAGLDAFTTRELLQMGWEQIFPPPQAEVGRFGRRVIEGRGHTPWVLRSSLDGRTRMLHLALAPDHWVSYGTQIGAIYQFWRGDVAWSGAVYDTRHGPEPRSQGAAFFREPDRPGFGLSARPDAEPAALRYLGHRFRDGGANASLRFLLTEGGTEVEVVETPELVREGEAVGLRRAFEVRLLRGVDASVSLRVPERGRHEAEGNRIEQGRLWLPMGRSQVTHWFDAPELPIEGRSGVGSLGPDALFEANDCSTCHGRHERVVGPSYREIAERHASLPRREAVEALVEKVLEGGVGAWGPVPMPPHPELTRTDAASLVRIILDTPPGEPLPADVLAETGDAGTYEIDVEPRPKALHPSLRARPLLVEGFTPKVGGLAWLPDGALAVATWDSDGAIFRVDDWDDPARPPRVQRIAEGLQEPLGLEVVDGALYVLQKQELTRLEDLDGDGWMDDYAAVSQAWSVTSNFHEFGFGLVRRGGWLYGALSVCVLPGGKSCPAQTADRGTVFRVSLEDGRYETVARGFRTPNGVGLLPDGGLLLTDNQGDWLPASKLLRIEPGSFHGWRAPADAKAALPPMQPPILWLPQNEIGNSPSEPVVLGSGPYAGQVVFGDVYNGGLKRASLQEVDGVLQGAAFHFSGGLRAAVNRILEAPSGELVVGEVGSTGNWAEIGKPWHGLELLTFGERAAFEPASVEVTASGLRVRFTRPLGPDQGAPPVVRLQQFRYVPTQIYGGPKLDLEDLAVRHASRSADGRELELTVDGIQEGRVVYLRLDPTLRSLDEEPLWVNEAWITVNAIPTP